MKGYRTLALIFTCLTFFCSDTFAQYDIILKSLPKKYEFGVVIYSVNDSQIYIFKSDDYITKSLEYIRQHDKYNKAGNSYMNVLKVVDDFYIANHKKYTEVSANQYLQSFPNEECILSLFKRKKIVVFQKNDLKEWKLIKYKVRKKRNYFDVISIGQNKTIFRSVYLKVENWGY
ncbi:MAG: hypothetical protein V4667_06035 [Bacteroidota bacterium]